MRILAIDPGGTTGVAMLDWKGEWPPDPSTLYGYREIDADEAALWFHQQLEWDRPDLIVMERFVISQRTLKVSRQSAPMDVIGGVKFLAAIANIPIKMQAASDAKTAWPNDRLSGWKIVGGHAKDALRHGLLALHSEVH